MSVRMEGPESKMYSPPEKRSGNDRNDPNVNSTFSTNKLQILYTYNFYWDVFRNWNGGKMRLCCIIDIDKKSFFLQKSPCPKKSFPPPGAFRVNECASVSICFEPTGLWYIHIITYVLFHPKADLGILILEEHDWKMLTIYLLLTACHRFNWIQSMPSTNSVKDMTLGCKW